MIQLKNCLLENNEVKEIPFSNLRFLGAIKGCIANYIKNFQTK